MASEIPFSSERSLNILVVDDDLDTHQLIAAVLKRANHNVFSAFSGAEAIALLAKENIDAVLLDVMMPNMDGITTLSLIRGNLDIPVLILTSLSNQDVIEKAFIKGADDYIIKPFSPQQLLDRIKILTQLIPPHNDAVTYISGNLSLTSNNRRFQAGDRAGDLSEIENRLLQYFMRNPDAMLSVKDLLMAGWSREIIYAAQDEEMLRLAINHLREKIETDFNNPVYFPLVNGDGYLFHPIE
jgi:two-component system, OmpR family, response regulator MprA